MQTTPKAKILDGRIFAKEMRTRLKTQVTEFTAQAGYPPHLAVMLVGDDPSSITYTRTLIKMATELGFKASTELYPASITNLELQTFLAELNADPEVHGITVQWPMPPHINFEDIAAILDPRKDVDGYHPLSLGRLYCRLETFVPATPLGGMQLLEYYGYDVKGKTCLLIGTGVTVGRALLALLLADRANVITANRLTTPAMLKDYAAQADFIFVAAGSPNLINGDMVKAGVVIIDFGTNYVDDKLVGDVDFESLLPIAGAITPTPGGTGPATNITLLGNVLKAAQQQLQRKIYNEEK